MWFTSARQHFPTTRARIVIHLLRRWLEMGFGESEILLAYDRTCLHAGGLKWQYMNSILTSWQQQNLYTVDQIQKYDRAPAKPGAAAAARQTASAVDPMAVRAIHRLMNEEEKR